MNLFHTDLFLAHLFVLFPEVHEKFHRVLRVAPSFFYIALWKLGEYFHEGNETVGDFDETSQDNEKADKEQKGFENVQNNGHYWGLVEMCVKSWIELYFGAVGHLIKWREHVVFEGGELSVIRSESLNVHKPESDDFFNEQVNNVNLVICGSWELGHERSWWVHVVHVDITIKNNFLEVLVLFHIDQLSRFLLNLILQPVQVLDLVDSAEQRILGEVHL